MIKKHTYLAMVVLGCACSSQGAEQGKLEGETVLMQKSPISVFTEDLDFRDQSSSNMSLSESEGEEREGVKKPSRVKKAKAFFENYKHRRSQRSSNQKLDSDYESESDESGSDGDQNNLKVEDSNPKKRQKDRALKALSLRLDRAVEMWNNFAASREDAQQDFEALAKTMIEQSTVLNQSGDDQEIQSLIKSKVSKIRVPARVTWEVWSGKQD